MGKGWSAISSGAHFCVMSPGKRILGFQGVKGAKLRGKFQKTWCEKPELVKQLNGGYDYYSLSKPCPYCNPNGKIPKDTTEQSACRGERTCGGSHYMDSLHFDGNQVEKFRNDPQDKRTVGKDPFAFKRWVVQPL